MPIYEYECKGCGHVFDALQKLSEDPLTDCPACGEAQLRKLLSAPNFRLKGGGWYETDFKTDNKRNLADGADGGAKSDGGDKKSTEDAGKADTKKDKPKADGGSKPSGGGDKAA